MTPSWACCSRDSSPGIGETDLWLNIVEGSRFESQCEQKILYQKEKKRTVEVCKFVMVNINTHVTCLIAEFLLCLVILILCPFGGITSMGIGGVPGVGKGNLFSLVYPNYSLIVCYYYDLKFLRGFFFKKG